MPWWKIELLILGNLAAIPLVIWLLLGLGGMDQNNPPKHPVEK